ncbi:MAG: formylglycine-generating enzyme family protein [Nitrospira sp.]|nr:formylglycine-generating enzyme family protein [Nitrospira sp.]
MIRFYFFCIAMSGILVFVFSSVGMVFAADKCPVNMVPVGPICVDIYEVSVWSKPPKENGTPQGSQFGATTDNYPCSDNGNDCSKAGTKIYAVSAKGVTPSRFITWFQAQQACANVEKRLLRNGEWQMAAAGTPTDYEPGADNGTTDCNTSTAAAVVTTGSRSRCVSNWRVFDMVGNLAEWVEEWIQDNEDIDGGTTSTALYGNDTIFGIDEAFPVTDRFPAAILRGGHFLGAGPAQDGVFWLDACSTPSETSGAFGFRCGVHR